MPPFGLEILGNLHFLRCDNGFVVSKNALFLGVLCLCILVKAMCFNLFSNGSETNRYLDEYMK